MDMRLLKKTIITLPITPADRARLQTLQAGDEVEVNGTIYVARDQAHMRMCEDISMERSLPFEISGAVIYYMGPSPAPKGKIIGAAGPTTSARMDPFTPLLLNRGLAGMIGKGPRSQEVVESLAQNKACYFYAYGGCGALYGSKVQSSEVIAYEDLGPEAIRKLEVKNFPLLLAVDSNGNSIFRTF